MFVVYGIDNGLVWMGSSVRSFTDVFVPEYVSDDSDYLMATSMF